jgi:hypothetical protein
LGPAAKAKLCPQGRAVGAGERFDEAGFVIDEDVFAHAFNLRNWFIFEAVFDIDWMKR